MQEDESSDEFYTKVNDIVNSRYKLGIKIAEPRVKILEVFVGAILGEVTDMEESKDLESIRIDELVRASPATLSILSSHVESSPHVESNFFNSTPTNSLFFLYFY